jgi:hypothetical protein
MYKNWLFESNEISTPKSFKWVSIKGSIQGSSMQSDEIEFPLFSFLTAKELASPADNFNLICELIVCGKQSDNYCTKAIQCSESAKKKGREITLNIT